MPDAIADMTNISIRPSTKLLFIVSIYCALFACLIILLKQIETV